MPSLDTERFPGLFLDGLAQFLDGEYFEAHETWEALWTTMPLDGPLEQETERLFYQACIQLSVALHHYHNGNQIGAVNLLAKAGQKFQAIMAEPRFNFFEQEWRKAESLILENPAYR